MSLRQITRDEAPRAAEVFEDAFAKTVFQQVLISQIRGVPFDTAHDIAHHRGTVLPRVEEFLDANADVVEVDDFAGVAMWLRPGQSMPPSTESCLLIDEFKEASKAIEKRHGLEGVAKYYLFMIARDPKVTARGTASKLIRPYLEKARKEKVKVTLEAISDSARAVYEHLGFRLVETAYMWKGLVNSKGEPDANGEGLAFHYMLYE